MNIDGQMYHVGIAVRDVDVAMERYKTLLGAKGFTRLDTNYPARHRQWEGTIANRNAFGKIGDLIVELVEPGLGAGPAHEFLRERGEGLFHIGFQTDDPGQRPDGVEACFEVQNARTPDGGCAIVYLDTVSQLGYFVELIYTPYVERTLEMVRSFS